MENRCYAMGALTRLIDPKAAMLCTQAVEEVIEQHYAEQIDELSSLDEPELLAKVSQFREEELEHRDIALRHDSSHSPGYFIIYHAVQSVCKLAINLSKKF